MLNLTQFSVWLQSKLFSLLPVTCNALSLNGNKSNTIFNRIGFFILKQFVRVFLIIVCYFVTFNNNIYNYIIMNNIQVTKTVTNALHFKKFLLPCYFRMIINKTK